MTIRQKGGGWRERIFDVICEEYKGRRNKMKIKLIKEIEEMKN